jgi:choline kinase
LNEKLSKRQNDKFTVLITTSGVGSRLGNLTQFTNKSLIVVGNKPVLAQIIEKYPSDTNFVITLGYFGNHVKEFLTLCYPELSFKFIEVSPFDGPKSSLGYSIWCARKYLQGPFIYHANDTLILNSDIPHADSDWVAGSKGVDGTNYASFDTQGELIETFHGKGMTEFDFIHIGLVSIHSYKNFWLKLEKLVNDKSYSKELNDVSVISQMMNDGIKFKVKEFEDWVDIGNASSLVLAKKKLGSSLNVLEKPQESVSFLKNSVVKFFSDARVVTNRVKRTEFLENTIPKLKISGNNFYVYDFHDGQLMSNSMSPESITTLLDWAKINLWSKEPPTTIENFESIVEDFYLTKSVFRINNFNDSRSIRDEPYLINNMSILSAKSLLMIARPYLTENVKIGRFHGDFILDNILTSNSGFKLIDWREDFGGNIEFGDIYYDLAKLNHSLHINHGLVQNGDFFVITDNSEIKCGILRKDVHVQMEKNLKKFTDSEGLNWKKIEILTALIWLNMAPLHHHPFDKFLYYYGRYHLQGALNV